MLNQKKEINYTLLIDELFKSPELQGVKKKLGIFETD